MPLVFVPRNVPTCKVCDSPNHDFINCSLLEAAINRFKELKREVPSLIAVISERDEEIIRLRGKLTHKECQIDSWVSNSRNLSDRVDSAIRKQNDLQIEKDELKEELKKVKEDVDFWRYICNSFEKKVNLCNKNILVEPDHLNELMMNAASWEHFKEWLGEEEKLRANRTGPLNAEENNEEESDYEDCIGPSMRSSEQ